MHYNRIPTRAIYAALVALSCGAYLNTLFSSFAFDDNFAVVRQFAALAVISAEPCPWQLELSWGRRLRPNVNVNSLTLLQRFLHTTPDPWRWQITNGDVTDPNKPLGVIFKNDFWWEPPERTNPQTYHIVAEFQVP